MATAVVVGGGFGGLAAATTLRERLAGDDDVVLIARDDRFAMGFAKLWDLAGQRPLEEGSRSLHDLAGRGIRFVHDEVVAIDAAGRSVTTGSGAVAFDVLVVALGSVPSPAHRQLLSAPGAHDLYDPRALPAMREALAGIAMGRVVVSILGGPFKCPPAPYEAALIVDGLLRAHGVRDDVDVVVTTPQPITLPAAGVDASRFVASHLDDHGIGLRAGSRVSTVDGGARSVTLTPMSPDGPGEPEQVGYDVLLGVPADSPPPVLAEAGLTAASGWIEPDPATLATGAERVYAVGDCTRIPTATAQLPHAGVFAAAQGRVAGHNAAACLTGAEPARFDGHGYCFLELPGEQVAFVEGDFYADPPDVELTPPDRAQFLRKQAYEREHLDAWFGQR